MKKTMKTTMDRSTYNKARKIYLEKTGEIHCTYCGYHLNENCTNKYYGWYEDDKPKYPNWKLVSKNRKQWMKKPNLTVDSRIVSWMNMVYKVRQRKLRHL